MYVIGLVYFCFIGFIEKLVMIQLFDWCIMINLLLKSLNEDGDL